MAKNIKLYNIVFPVWALYVVPFAWIVILPANFLIDSIVVITALAIMRTGKIKEIYKRIILKVWGLGFAADILGSICLMILIGFTDDITHMKYRGLTYDTQAYPIGLILISAAVIISGVLIYLFNYYGNFKELELPQDKKRKLALTLAITTAPYLMFLPADFFYS